MSNLVPLRNTQLSKATRQELRQMQEGAIAARTQMVLNHVLASQAKLALVNAHLESEAISDGSGRNPIVDSKLLRWDAKEDIINHVIHDLWAAGL